MTKLPPGGPKFQKNTHSLKWNALLCDQAPSGGSEISKTHPMEIISPSSVTKLPPGRSIQHQAGLPNFLRGSLKLIEIWTIKQNPKWQPISSQSAPVRVPVGRWNWQKNNQVTPQIPPYDKSWKKLPKMSTTWPLGTSKTVLTPQREHSWHFWPFAQKVFKMVSKWTLLGNLWLPNLVKRHLQEGFIIPVWP